MWAFTRKDLAAIFRNEDVVLDADAELAGDVYSGFDRDDLAGLERALGVLFEEGDLVDFQTEAVPASMAKDGQAALADDGPGRCVDRRQFRVRPGRCDRSRLGPLDDLIGSPIGCGGFAHHEATRDVTAVSPVAGPEVDQDRVGLAELSLRRLMVGP